MREVCRQGYTEVISNSRNKLHQTTYKDFFSALYMPRGNDEKQQLGFWDERRCHTVLNATVTVGLHGLYCTNLR